MEGQYKSNQSEAYQSHAQVTIVKKTILTSLLEKALRDKDFKLKGSEEGPGIEFEKTVQITINGEPLDCVIRQGESGQQYWYDPNKPFEPENLLSKRYTI